MGVKKIHISSLASQAERALKQAVRHLIKEHQQTGQPVVVWRAGKVVKIPADRLLRQPRSH